MFRSSSLKNIWEQHSQFLHPLQPPSPRGQPLHSRATHTSMVCSWSLTRRGQKNMYRLVHVKNSKLISGNITTPPAPCPLPPHGVGWGRIVMFPEISFEFVT